MSLANIDLELKEQQNTKTKTTDRNKDVEMNYYLLANPSQQLIEKHENNEHSNKTVALCRRDNTKRKLF